MTFYRDEQGARLPVKIDATSNGEFAPRPLTAPARHAVAIANQRATANARRLGTDRRRFLVSACGAASSLLAINEATAAARPAGFYALDQAAALEPAAAEAVLDGSEFIFDVQTHHVNPAGAWRPSIFDLVLRTFPQARCGDGLLDRVFGSIDCFSVRHFVKEVFLDSDTNVAVLSFVPTTKADMPLTVAEGDQTRRIVDALEGCHRLLLHGPINPRAVGELELMPEMSERWGVSAWKTYTQWGPDGVGYWLDDEAHGTPFIEAVRTVGPKRICIHKGIPFPDLEYRFSRCRDVGVVAKRYPDVDFIIYHSGYEIGRPERAYEPGEANHGVDTLVESLLANDVAPNSTVYAEIGSSWRFLMRSPEDAAHFLGKLLKYVGEDRVLWGTDSIWYGSPQDQIQAFRAFQIGAEVRERHGYPEITPELRAKVFGLNGAAVYGLDAEDVRRHAADDTVGRLRRRYAPEREPSHLTYGPATRRQFLRLRRAQAGRPT